MKIGFIGLGKMGKYMALNMLKSGDEFIVNDVASDNFPVFEEKGAVCTTDIKKVAEADIVFLSLPNSEVVQNVVIGENGLIKYLKKDCIIVDLSTITYETTIEIANILKKSGIEFIDAPVSGMEAKAEEATLAVMCGGSQKAFDKIKPYLELIGNTILYMGESGSGQLTKLINQLLFDINVAALSEILPMAVKMGLDSEKVGQVVNNGTGRSFASEFFIPRNIKRDFTEGYQLKNAYKDLISAAEISAKFCIPLPVLHAATTTYQMALLQGYGDKNKGSMINVFEKLLDVEYKS